MVLSMMKVLMFMDIVFLDQVEEAHPADSQQPCGFGATPLVLLERSANVGLFKSFFRPLQAGWRMFRTSAAVQVKIKCDQALDPGFQFTHIACEMFVPKLFDDVIDSASFAV